MSIFNTTEKNVSNIDRKLDKSKLLTSSIKSSSTIFSCSIRVIYNRVHRDKNQRLMLKSYIPAVNKSNFPKKHNENIFSEKHINELHSCI